MEWYFIHYRIKHLGGEKTEKSSQRKRKGTVIKRRRQDIPKYCQGAGKEVSSEGLKERRRGHFNGVVIVWREWNRLGLTLKL